MKINPWSFGIIFLVITVFLLFNNFQLPTLFIFEKTNKIKAVITHIDWTYGIKGSSLQLLNYEYEVLDSIYSDQHKAGIGFSEKTKGDYLLIEYSINNPSKNKVIGQYKSTHKIDYIKADN